MEKIEILEETENPLFKRKELRINITTNSSPKNIEVKESLAQKFSVPKENIKIKKIDGKFGSKNFIISANVYESEEAKNTIEPDKKGESEQPSEEPKKEESQENKVEEKENAEESS